MKQKRMKPFSKPTKEVRRFQLKYKRNKAKRSSLELLVLLHQGKRTKALLANRQRRFADSNQNIKGIREIDMNVSIF